MAITATKGTLNWAYPPYILSTTAAVLCWDVSIFISFYRLKLLKKDVELKISPLGNPAIPIKFPMGSVWLQGISWYIRNVLMGNVQALKQKNVPEHSK